jgi:hypothetical protein
VVVKVRQPLQILTAQPADQVAAQVSILMLAQQQVDQLQPAKAMPAELPHLPVPIRQQRVAVVVQAQLVLV